MTLQGICVTLRIKEHPLEECKIRLFTESYYCSCRARLHTIQAIQADDTLPFDLTRLEKWITKIELGSARLGWPHKGKKKKQEYNVNVH
jgi:hypothetical protein